MRFYYVSVGSGKRVIFVHGFPEFWAEWENQLVEFGKDHQVVDLNMRGYNLSSKPVNVESYRAKYLIEDLRALAEHPGHKKFIWLICSLGIFYCNECEKFQKQWR